MNLSRRGLLGMLAAGTGAAIVGAGIIMPIKPKLAAAPKLEFICGRASMSFEGAATYTINGVDIYGNKITETGSISSVGGLQTNNSFAVVTSVVINQYSHAAGTPVFNFGGPVGMTTVVRGNGRTAIDGMSNEQVQQMARTGVLPCGLSIDDMHRRSRPLLPA